MGPSQNLDGSGDAAALSATPQSAAFETAGGPPQIVAVTAPQFSISGVTTAPPGAETEPAADPVGTGVAQAVGAPAAEAEFGVTGAGVKIGILSDSFNVLGGAAQDEADGALPASGVTVLAEGPAGSTDEGRAMAEIVHSVAPGAQLLFATAQGGEQAFANNITALANAGAKIIVDDITYFAEPFFQDGGPIDQAIEAAEAKGVQFFTSAGNEANNFIQGTFNPIETTLPGSTQQVTAENFGNGSALLPVVIGAGATIDFDLQWAQPFGSFGTGQSAQNSLALEVFDPSNPSAPLVVSTVSDDAVGGDPVQVVGISNSGSAATVDIAIVDNGYVADFHYLYSLRFEHTTLYVTRQHAPLKHEPEKPLWDGSEPLQLSFAAGEDDATLMGFNPPEEWGAWSETDVATITLPELVAGEITLKLNAGALRENMQQPLRLRVGDAHAELLLTEAVTPYELRLALDWPTDTIRLEMPTVRPAPRDLRSLGVALSRIEISRP